MTEDELEVARSWRAGQLSVELQSPRAIASALTTLVVHDLPDDYHARLRESLLAADVDQVSAAAAAHLHPDALTLVVEGDAAVIRDDLVAAGLGELVDLTRPARHPCAAAIRPRRSTRLRHPAERRCRGRQASVDRQRVRAVRS